MLPKQFRLDLRSQKNFFSSCKRIHFPYFSFFYNKNDQKKIKAAVIVPKKAVKLASKRNEVKRRYLRALEEVIGSDKESRKNKNLSINLVIIVNKKGISEEVSSLVEKIESGLIEISV